MYLVNPVTWFFITLTSIQVNPRWYKCEVTSYYLNPKHKAHDGRKHFVTIAKKYNVDEYAIKYMVGHSIMDITERVYTDRTIDWLKCEIEKIK